MQELLKKYKLVDIYNTDETAFYFLSSTGFYICEEISQTGWWFKGCNS